jgi:hypothetical protein
VGYELETIEVFKVGEVDVELRATYTGTGFPIEITSWLVSRVPIDVFLHPAGSLTVLEKGEVRSLPAIFERVRPGRPQQASPGLRFVEDGIETTIYWRITEPSEAEFMFQEVVRIAESLP